MHSIFTYAQPSPLCYISSIIRKRFSIWTSSRLCHNIFMSASTLALRRSKNIGNFLVRAKLRNPSQNTIPPRLFSRRQPLFYVHRHIKLALLLTYSFSSAKEDLLLTTLSATLKTLFTGFSANPVKRYIGETRRRSKDRLNKHHRPGSWQAHQHIRTFLHWSSHR